MRGLLTSLFLICTLLSNGVASFARDNKSPKRQRSRVERKESKTSAHNPKARTKRESKHELRRELAKRRELIKRNPRLAFLFKGEETEEVLRSDQPREAIEWYLQKRLPKGEKQLPVERYFQAKEKIKKMRRFSSRNNKNLPSAT